MSSTPVLMASTFLLKIDAVSCRSYSSLQFVFQHSCIPFLAFTHSSKLQTVRVFRWMFPGHNNCGSLTFSMFIPFFALGFSNLFVSLPARSGHLESMASGYRYLPRNNWNMDNPNCGCLKSYGNHTPISRVLFCPLPT